MLYETFSLENKLRIIYLQSHSPVSYCGFAVNAGTRDEEPQQSGLAHFIEHMLFKGTQKRKAWHILNRMENVGGELNAYTTKEETFLYTVCLSSDVERAIELLSDLLFHSQFPETEIKKEREVVIDEINSYRDNPSELIFDEFENLLFQGNEMGHNILGDEAALRTFTQDTCREFTGAFYHPDNLIFFFYGQSSFKDILRLARKYFPVENNTASPRRKREIPENRQPEQVVEDKGLHQSYVIVGGRGYDLYNRNGTGLFLLNNLLGGPGMNSRLNVVLREKNGLVYSVDSGLSAYTDSGVFTIYFACDHDSTEQCLHLVYKELKKMRENKLTTSQLNAVVKQLKGQLGISRDQKENLALGMGKNFLHCNTYKTLDAIFKKIDALTSIQLGDIANELWDESRLFQLIYH
jgi:predicted Zn-dependent peptidase